MDLHPGQDEIVKEILKDDTKWHIVSCGRQFGKTLMSMGLMVHWMLDNKNVKGVWISPFTNQSEQIYYDIVNACKKYIKSNNAQQKRIVWFNDSVLQFKSAENYDSIRGGTYHYGVIDEATFVRPEAFPVIRPVFSVLGKKVLVISTPKIKNWFYDYFQLGLDESETNFKSYKAISTDNPFFPQDDLDEARRTQPDDIVRQEYFAEFLEIEGRSYVFGIDWGAKNDKSVLIIIDIDTREVVLINESKHSNYPDIVAGFVDILDRFNIVKGYAEVNGVGRPVFDYLKLKVSNVQPFTMTNKNKRQVVSSLRQSLELNKLKLPVKSKCIKLFKQMSTYQVKATAGGNITYTHPAGGHDDYVDSLVLSHWALIKCFDEVESSSANWKKTNDKLTDAEWAMEHRYNNNEDW